MASKKNISTYLYDNPESELENDLLGYKNYVEELSQLIIQTFDEKRGLNIGIVGSWGDGKTTAISMCLTRLKKHFSWHKKLNWWFFIPVLTIFISTLLIYSNDLKNIFILLVSNAVIQTFFKYICQYFLVLFLVALILHNQIFSLIKRLFDGFKRTFCSLFFQKDYVEIWFSPWSCSDDRQLMQEYLKTIAESFGFDLGFASNLLLRYSKLIVGKDLSWLSNLFNPAVNLSELKDKIAKKLKNSNKRIIVVIDDLDRIQCDEIYNVLKLIGTVANFPNVINILSYDKEYIIKELKKCINTHSKTEIEKEIFKEDTKEYILETKIEIENDKASKYVEKIINIESPLPKIEQSNLKKFFFDKLNNVVKGENV